MMVLHLASVFIPATQFYIQRQNIEFSIYYNFQGLSNLGHSMQHMTWRYKRLLFHCCENFHSIKIPFCEDIVFIQWIQLGIYEKLQIARDKFLLNKTTESHEHNVWQVVLCVFFLVSNCRFCNHTRYPLMCNIKFLEIPIYTVRWIRKNYVFLLCRFMPRRTTDWFWEKAPTNENVVFNRSPRFRGVVI